jgi:hypothetical protein
MVPSTTLKMAETTTFLLLQKHLALNLGTERIGVAAGIPSSNLGQATG